LTRRGPDMQFAKKFQVILVTALKSREIELTTAVIEQRLRTGRMEQTQGQNFR